MALIESILQCYNDKFGLKTQIRILCSSKLTQLHNSNTIWELSSGMEYVNKVCVVDKRPKSIWDAIPELLKNGWHSVTSHAILVIL
jgi:hypothetical protein